MPRKDGERHYRLKRKYRAKVKDRYEQWVLDMFDLQQPKQRWSKPHLSEVKYSVRR